VTQVTVEQRPGAAAARASGTTSWSIGSITLQSGVNVITVTAWNAQATTAPTPHRDLHAAAEHLRHGATESVWPFLHGGWHALHDCAALQLGVRFQSYDCYDLAAERRTGIQYVWSSWSDSGAMSHTVAPSANMTYTANFTTQY